MTANTGDPVMLPADVGRLITGGALNARLLVLPDRPSYASTRAMTVAPGFGAGAHIHYTAQRTH